MTRTQSTTTVGPRMSLLAAGGLVLAIFTLLLAGLAAHLGPPAVQRGKIPSDVMAWAGYLAPLVLGLVATILGASAFTVIERSEGRLYGDGAAVFSMFIGLFASIVAGCAVYANLLW